MSIATALTVPIAIVHLSGYEHVGGLALSGFGLFALTLVSSVVVFDVTKRLADLLEFLLTLFRLDDGP